MKHLLVAATAAVATSAVLVGCGGQEKTDAEAKPPATNSASTATAPSTDASLAPAESTTASDPSTAGHVIERKELDDMVEKKLKEGTGLTVVSSCNGGLTGPVGTRQTCLLTTGDGPMQLDAVVTEVFEHGLAFNLEKHEG